MAEDVNTILGAANQFTSLVTGYHNQHSYEQNVWMTAEFYLMILSFSEIIWHLW
jgi:hypothetical protein